MKTEPLTPGLGSLVDVDLRSTLGADDEAELCQLLTDRALLVFPRQRDLGRADQVHLAEVFGEPAPAARGDATEPFVERIVHDETAPPTENIWHADSTFLEQPPRGTVLRAMELPLSGGDTLFADMGAVWRSLPAQVRALLEPARCVHDIAKWLADSESVRQLHAVAPPRTHPVVRLHPRTGEPVLNANRAYTTRIEGMEESSSRALLDYLFAQVTVPEVQCRVRWRLGTVVVWDNCAVQHYATGDYFPQRRVMDRVVLAGDPVFGPVEASPAGLAGVPSPLRS